jgi:phage regulator Rha-like protein
MNNMHNKENQLALIQSKIYEIRGRRVMIDSDLAELYNVETKNLKRAVRSNIERFPDDFMFELTKEEYESLRCNFFTLNKNGRGQHSKYLPFAFTQEGIAMLSGLLRSSVAIQVNINIMRAFVQMRQALLTINNAQLQLEQIRSEVKQLRLDMEETLHDQNDINESTRMQLDAISTALAELQSEHHHQPKRKPIGFRQPEEKDED